MSNIITFGKCERKTFEWLFFNTPWYAEYIIYKRMHRQEHLFEPEEGDYFKELHRRASHLAGTCTRCHERPVTYMGLTHHHGSEILSPVGFYCDECESQGGSITGYCTLRSS